MSEKLSTEEIRDILDMELKGDEAYKTISKALNGLSSKEALAVLEMARSDVVTCQLTRHTKCVVKGILNKMMKDSMDEMPEDMKARIREDALEMAKKAVEKDGVLKGMDLSNLVLTPQTFEDLPNGVKNGLMEMAHDDSESTMPKLVKEMLKAVESGTPTPGIAMDIAKVEEKDE